MPRKSRKSFVGHPGAILFLLISRAGVLQHPLLVTFVRSFVRNGKAVMDAFEEEK